MPIYVARALAMAVLPLQGSPGPGGMRRACAHRAGTPSLGTLTCRCWRVAYTAVVFREGHTCLV